MAMDESYWINRAQSAEAKLATLESNTGPMKEKIQNFKLNWGIKEKGDGSWDIDFDKFVERLGMEQALGLREIIDEKYRISGAAGEKPKVRVNAG